MADNAWPWQKIIRMRDTSYAVLDELAYYREIYATSGSCKGEEYVLPPFSSFIADDAKVSRTLVTQGKRFDFILLDPPWPNRSVKRKSTYTTHGEVELLLDLYIQELLKESGLLAFWITNSPGILHFVDEFIDRHEFEKIATWRWLKVTRTGEPVYSLESKHKQPFESVIFICNNNLEFYREKIVDEFVLIR
ncbi:unnamed protein product [Gongylonema pulchrum]|uniref:MT-A70 family protein n=1 Tax=Gongylonema pulchrum TaxID=637853 RepID=A0A183E7L8_9BILA|nr:unnamed protein product [Gongylonema pulchrum]